MNDKDDSGDVFHVGVLLIIFTFSTIYSTIDLKGKGEIRGIFWRCRCNVPAAQAKD